MATGDIKPNISPQVPQQQASGGAPTPAPATPTSQPTAPRSAFGGDAEDAKKARELALKNMKDFLHVVIENQIRQRYTNADAMLNSDAAKAFNRILQNFKAKEVEILAKYEEHLDAIAAFPATTSLIPLEPEQFVELNADLIWDGIQPGAVYSRAASTDIESFKSELDSFFATTAFVAEQRAERKRQLKTDITELKNQLVGLSMNKEMFTDPQARNVLDIAQARLEQAATTLVEEYGLVADQVAPQDFLNQRLPQYLAPYMLNTGIAIPTTDALSAVSAIIQGATKLQTANAQVAPKKEALAVQQKLQQAKNQQQIKTIADIRAQFPDRPDLALKAEVAYRNDLIANPQSDPNTFVQQFAGQAEGEKRIAQGLFDAGLDTSTLTPETSKLLMEKGLTAETLPSLVSSLPAFKTQFPTADEFGAKEISEAMIKKAIAEQPGNPMLSINAQLQPSPTNPNAPITPAYADAITRQSEQTGISPTALAHAQTGNPAQAIAEQNIRANNRTGALTSIGSKFGVTNQQINQAVLERVFGKADVASGKYRMYLSGLDDGSVPDVDSHYVGTLFQSGQQDPYSVIGGLIPDQYKQAWGGIKPEMDLDTLNNIGSSLPDYAKQEAEAKKKQQEQAALKQKMVSI